MIGQREAKVGQVFTRRLRMKMTCSPYRLRPERLPDRKEWCTPTVERTWRPWVMLLKVA